MAALAVLSLTAGVGATSMRPATAQGKATTAFTNFQPIGCYFNPADKKLWLAAISLNQKFTDPAFYDDDSFFIIMQAGDNKFDIDGKDILVHPMASFDFKGRRNTNS
jgi:hypothetical protein